MSGSEAVTGTRYEVRCAKFAAESFAAQDQAREAARYFDRNYVAHCGPHTVWSIDPDGTETDITDEQGAQE